MSHATHIDIVTHHHPPSLRTHLPAWVLCRKKKLAKYVAVDRLLQKAHPGVEVMGVPAYLQSSETFPAHDTIPTLLHSYRPYSHHFRVSAEDKFSSRHFDQLGNLFLFTTEICYVFGQDNVVADAVPRIKTIAAQVNHDGIAASQVGETRYEHFWIGTLHHGSKVSRHLPAILRQICRKFSVVLTITSTKAGNKFLAQCHPEERANA